MSEELNKIETIALNYIEQYFRDNTLVSHHIDSCNYFYEHSIKEIFKDLNPILYQNEYDEKHNLYKYNIEIYIGGKEGDKIYFGKPMNYKENQSSFLFPNECRLKNITYATNLFYDVDIYYTIYDQEFKKSIKQKALSRNKLENNHFELGSFPIMLKSNLCVLNNFDKNVNYQLGECKHDYGGYFIIDGKEKVLVPQESFGNNVIYIRELKDNIHDYSVEIKSVSEDNNKPKRTLSIRRVKERNQFMIDIANVKKEIPLFIVFRALGITSDEEICKCILGDLKERDYYLEYLRTSIEDCGYIFTQLQALKFISTFLKFKNIYETHNILSNFLLPHIGEMNYKSKALYLGYMTMELLKVIQGERNMTDRDNYKYKRVETSGVLMKELFSEYAKIMYKGIHLSIEKEYYYNEELYKDDEDPYEVYIEKKEKAKKGEVINIESRMFQLVKDSVFQVKYIEDGFKKAFKGNWGAYAHTKRLSVIQDLNRLSYNSFISHLRKINLEIDSSSKIVGPHLLHGSQYGLLDPVDTPDGGNVGLHKHMAIMCKITNSHSVKKVYDHMKQIFGKHMHLLEECSYEMLYEKYKLFINGNWVSMVDIDKEEENNLENTSQTNILYFKNEFIRLRRYGFIPYDISISIDFMDKLIYINSDEGRLMRPLMYFVGNEQKTLVLPKEGEKNNWSELIQGKLFKNNDFNDFSSYDMSSLDGNQKYLEYLDSDEIEKSYIAMSIDKCCNQHSHLEIHPSLMFGVMGNQVIFPENNQLPRNLFGCGQAKQAVSLYHSNYIYRIDKMGVVLNYGQKPIVRSRYFNYIHEEEHPYGENVVVAIMCHSSYNVEDAILMNEASVKRGLFRTTYYNMYETYDELSDKSSKKIIDNPNKYDLTRQPKPGYNYNYLDDNGLIKENTFMNDKNVVIGKLTINDKEVVDSSITPKKGQLGYVDKAYLCENNGRKIAKIRMREDRTPYMGDKFCSRCGQKGTIGQLIPEENMPFTKSGLRPDIIVNPHALPSRMTIGQLIETVLAKLCCLNGNSADSTAFLNKGPKHNMIGEHLIQYGFQSEGNELLYNGMTGEQIESKIFMGPTYYMRLKHMVKDKINYRATGPRDLLTRQTNHGRANDGGLRIGEMERDGVISHGMTSFLKDSMMKRGDAYKMAVCNHSGTIAIYNKEQNYFYSLLKDGPIQYDIENEDTKPSLITKYGKEFSIVEIPYSLKLLMQELTSINVQMRLITSDNIEQLTKYSKTTLSQLTQSEPNVLEKEEPPLGEITDLSSEESEKEESETEASENEASENNDSPQKNHDEYEGLEEVFITLDQEKPDVQSPTLPPPTPNLPPPTPNLPPPPNLPPSNVVPSNLPPPQQNLTQLIEEPEIPVNNNDFDEQSQIDESSEVPQIDTSEVLNPNQPIVVSKIE